MLRQQLLARESPTQVTVARDESILRRPAGDAQLMHVIVRLGRFLAEQSF
jgi:hypothetical protein